MARLTEQVQSTLPEEISTQVTGLTIKEQVTVFSPGRMVIDMRDSIKLTRNMEQVHTTLPAEISTQVTGLTIKEQVTVFSPGRMVIDMRVNTRMV